jgi:hypothetical protein
MEWPWYSQLVSALAGSNVQDDSLSGDPQGTCVLKGLRRETYDFLGEESTGHFIHGWLEGPE